MGRTVIAASRRPAYHIVLDVIACIACILSLASCALTSKGSSPAANPSISVTPSLVSFGNVKIKTQTSQTLRLSNPGTKDLVISQAAISGEAFSVSGLTAPLTVAAGTSMNFTVLFQPTTTGTASASISISSNATSTPLTVSLTGTGVAESTPAISVTPTAISFGNLTVMSSATQTVTVSNTGTAALSISQTIVSGTGFSMSGFSAPVSVPAGSSTNFTVAFQPTTTGPASGSVSITSNASPSPLIIAISGTGAAAVAPSITAQPASQTVTVGQTATFSVAANGTAPLSYQWKKNGANISGATGTTYTTPATTTSDSGSTFTVVVANSTGSATSNAAALTVNAAAVAPSITTQPASQTVTVGQTATFSVAANGTAPLSYQWKKNGSNISGATGTTYTTPATTTSDSGSTFTVVVTNSAGSATSDSAILTVSTGTQHTYSTTFPLTESPISDGGNWVGGQSAGGNLWGNVQSVSGLAFGVSEPTQFGDPTAILTGTWGGNQTVSGTVKVDTSPGVSCCHEIELRLRMTITANSIKGYEAYCSIHTNNQYCHIARWNGPNGSYCNIEASTPSTFAQNGDVLLATAAGTNPTIINLYQNGNLVATATDTGQNCSPGGAAGPWTFGNPGIGFYDSQDNNWSNFGFSNFSAQDNSSSSPNTLAAVSSAANKAVVSSANRQSASTNETAETSTGVLTDSAPALTIQPVGLSIVRGSAATFSVLSGGTPPLHYQWRKNGLDIEGAVDASYTTPPTSLTDGGAIFDVVVSNSAGTVTSNPARLTVSLGTQKAYTTTFPIPETPISEGGNWVSGGTVGLDWRDVQTSSGVAIGTDSESTALGDSIAVLAGKWKPDQMAQATVRAGKQDCSDYEGVELFLRTTIAEHVIAGYKFGFRCASDGSQYTQILRWNGPIGSWTELGGNTGPALHSGDVLKVMAVGETLTAYINGTALLSVRDTTYSDGNPGLGFYNETGGTVRNSNFGFSSFYASEIVESNSIKSTK
jgi:hypothetical protein